MAIATKRAPQIAEGIARRQCEFEGVLGRKFAVGGGSESIEFSEVFMENRQRLKTDVACDAGQSGMAFDQRLFR